MIRFALLWLVVGVIVLTLVPASPGAPLPYTGVNLSGGEFVSPKPGVRPRANRDFVYPGDKEIAYFTAHGTNVIRVPFRWATIQASVMSDFDKTEIDRLAKVIDGITAAGCVAILDPHDYARYYGKVVGGPDVSAAAFADFWMKLADRFKDDPKVWFGLMNEPHDMPAEQWVTDANAAITGIRSTGAKNLVLVPGIAWTGAHSWKSSGNAVAMLKIVDPGDHFVFEAHQYLDADSSGTKPTIVSPTIGSERLRGFTEWCRTNHRKAFLGEFGAPANAAAGKAVDDMLTYMESNADVWTGYTWWAAGSWWGNYMFSIEPDKSGADKPQLEYLKAHMQSKSVAGKQ